jgi:hypothetical protein
MANRVDAQSVGRMEAVTPSDTTRFLATIGLTANVTGTVRVLCVNDTSTNDIVMNSGVWYPVRAIAVYDTGTDADLGITALYEE